MKTIYQIEDFEPRSDPISLTIGNFDGVHLGHQAILSKLKNRKVVFTFSNHPVEILKSQPFHLLTTPVHRLELLQKQDIDTTIMVPFTKSFSKQSAETFLVNFHRKIPFSSLILGHDAMIGHERQGDATQLHILSQKLGFTLKYIDPVMQNEVTVSSSAIRTQIRSGQFEKASALLGRPYSILSTVEPGEQHGRLLGFQTANLKVHSLCLPPLGVYTVKAITEGKTYLGVANLGKAPTLHANRPPILEVHLIGFKGELYQKTVEVVFLKFLREEKRFASIEALKKQINQDIRSALTYSKKAAD